jgi:aminopeptidase N
LIQNDIDLFNRYEAVQKIYLDTILGKADENSFLKVFQTVLNSDVNNYLKSYMLKFPEFGTIFDNVEIIEVEKIYSKVKALKNLIKNRFENSLKDILENSRKTSETDLSQNAIGKRAIKNICLEYLNSSKLAESEYQNSKTMTEKLKSLEIAKSENLFKNYLKNFGNDQEMIVKYFRIISAENDNSPIQKISETINSDLFDYKVPNLVRGLIGTFSRNYRYLFTKSGMEFFATELAKVDEVNPHTSARLCETINLYPKLEKDTQKIVFNSLEKFYKSSTISKNSFEILNRVFSTH